MAGDWDTYRQDTITEIEAITPTVDPTQTWKVWQRGEERPTRGRVFSAELSAPEGGVQVFGAGRQQLARTLLVETTYTRTTDYHARRAADEGDIEEAVAPSSTYPSGLYVRRLKREDVREEWDPETRTIVVTFPILHVYRETVTLV